MEEVDLKELLGVFWRKKFIVLAIMILFIVVGTVYSYKFLEPEYKSFTTIILGRINSRDVSDQTQNAISQQDLNINSNLVSTYSELIKSDTLIRQVLNNLQIDNIDEKDLKKAIDVTRKADTELIEIAVKNKDPYVAASIANEISAVFFSKVEEIYNISNVYTIDPAIPMSEPYNINHLRDVLLSVLFGFLVSLGYVLIVSMLDNTVRVPADVENNVGLKTLISIPKMDKEKEESTELITFADGKSLVSETFKTLRTNVQFTNINKKENKIMLITSCYPSEGKSYVSANLAVTFAQTGKKVVLIDADMRRGRQSKVFNKPNTLGLSNYLSSLDQNGMETHAGLKSFITETDIPNLSIITAGNIPPNPSELLDSDRLYDLIKELDSYYDMIIFDGPPILPVADSLILARIAHSTLIVALAGKTKKEELIEVKNSILNVGGRIIGVALNKVNINSYKYEKKSYYYYSQDEEPKNKKGIHLIKMIKDKIAEFKEKRKEKQEESIKNEKNVVEEQVQNENEDNYSLFENKEEVLEKKEEVPTPVVEEPKLEEIKTDEEKPLEESVEIKSEVKEEIKEEKPEEKEYDVEVLIDQKEELKTEDKKEDAFNKVYNEKIRQITDSFKAFKESLVKDSKNISEFIKDKNDFIKTKIEEDKKEKEEKALEEEKKIVEEEIMKEREETEETSKDDIVINDNDKALEDELFKRELEEAERIKALEEEKAKYSESKQKAKEERKRLREEKIKERKEKKRLKREEREARKLELQEEKNKKMAEQKINEDILEDNLYPKTKDYKDL